MSTNTDYVFSPIQAKDQKAKLILVKKFLFFYISTLGYLLSFSLIFVINIGSICHVGLLI